MNPFAWIGKKIGLVAVDFALAVAHLFGLAKRLEIILRAEKPLADQLIKGVTLVIGDVETLLAEAQTAFTDGGLNFPVDSAAYQSFLKLLADARALVPIVEDELAALEGKPLPVPIANFESPAATAPQPAARATAAAAAQKGPGLDKVVGG